MKQVYTSAIDRLRSLPPVFTGSDLTVRFAWNSRMASSYLTQWRKAGLVRSLGGHSDVHMNLVTQPQADPERALRMAFPRAVLVGSDILRQAGWTTQIHSMPEAAIPEPGPRFALNDFDLQPRSAAWFDLVAPGTLKTAMGAARLSPAWALADMIARASDRRRTRAWLLAPDDIDLAEARNDSELPAALRAFGLDPNAAQEERYAAVFDARQRARAGTPYPAPGSA